MFDDLENIEIVTDTTHEGVREVDFFYRSNALRVRGMLTLPIDEYPPFPLIVFNHGGIQGIYAGLKAISHDLSANHGYVVFAPSYRGEGGSEGEVELAHGEVDDVLNGLKLVVSSKDIDKNRVFMVGSSHGALITLIAMSKDKEGLIRKGVWGYGIADIFKWWEYLEVNGYLDNNLISREYYPGDPKDNFEFFNDRNGMNYISGIKAPLLIIQGDRDWIVPVEQAHMLKKAFDDAGIDNVRLEIVEGADHGLLTDRETLPDGTKIKSKHCKHAWKLIIDFLSSD
jgi:dipeptidyl aminopeptidase/acylaminoacyl peptidase